MVSSGIRGTGWLLSLQGHILVHFQEERNAVKDLNHKKVVKSAWQNIISSKFYFFFRDDVEGLLAILKDLMKFAEGDYTKIR